MAKKDVNKSDEVRKEFAKGNTAPKDVVATLAKRGLTVSPALVSQLKKRAGHGKSNGKAHRGGKMKVGAIDVKTILDVQHLVHRYGADHIKQIVDEIAVVRGA